MSVAMRIPDDYSLHYLRFAGTIYAVVRVDRDGYPTIYINVDLAPEAQRRALAHELRHIERGDMTSHVSIYDVESDVIEERPTSVFFRAWRPVPGEVVARMRAVGEEQRAEIERMIRTEPVGEVLRELRKRKRLRVAECAEILGMDAARVAALESGEASPTPEEITKAGALYGVRLEGCQGDKAWEGRL